MLQSSCHTVHITDSNNHVIVFANDKRFGVVVRGQGILEGNITVGREWETSNVAIRTIHETSFPSLSVEQWFSKLPVPPPGGRWDYRGERL
jgi:hypothetical protein